MRLKRLKPGLYSFTENGKRLALVLVSSDSALLPLRIQFFTAKE